jgi:hypothetical protein
MRNDLHELARLAKPGSDSPVQGFDTADSSGFVDLSAYSTNDPGWVDRELARARKGEPPPPPPRAGGKAIDALLPASMAPVSLEVPGDPDDTMNVRPSRARGAIYTVMGVAAVAAVGFLAFTLAKHPPPPPASTTAAAAAPPPAAATVDPAAVTAASATTTAPTTSTATTTVAVAVATPAPVAAVETHTSKARKKAFAATRARPVAQAAEAAPAAAPAHVAVEAPAAVIPKSKPAAGGDSLMDLIKKSVATGK